MKLDLLAHNKQAEEEKIHLVRIALCEPIHTLALPIIWYNAFLHENHFDVYTQIDICNSCAGP